MVGANAFSPGAESTTTEGPHPPHEREPTGASRAAFVLTRARCFALMLLAIVGMLLFGAASPAGASTPPPDSAERFAGSVVNRTTDDDGNRESVPVEGVRIEAIGEDGTVVGEATTDAEGRYVLGLPGPGTYTLRLDVDSLPEGVAPEEGVPTERIVQVLPNQEKVGSFFLGADTRDVKSRLSLLPQTLANGVKLSFIVAICAIGLSLIYGTTGLSNFAHGDIVTLGAMVAWLVNIKGGWHILIAAPFGIAASALAGAAMERGLWRPLRGRRASLTSMMIVSIGISLGVRYIYQFYFGARSKPFREYAVQREVDLGPFSLTPRAMTIMAICLVALLATSYFLLRTRTGKAVRAVADNPALASATGINSDHIILIVWVLGGALAGLGGVLYGLEVRVQWSMGFTLLLLLFAAITVGGLGRPFGALVGAFVVGMFVELWTWVFPSVVELKTVGALLALIVVLLVRPQGILGKRERIG